MPKMFVARFVTPPLPPSAFNWGAPGEVYTRPVEADDASRARQIAEEIAQEDRQIVMNRAHLQRVELVQRY